MNIQLFLYLLLSTLAASQLCGVDCGDGWCCIGLDKCLKANGNWVCLSPFLTESDGSSATFSALNAGEFSSLYSSLSLTITAPIISSFTGTVTSVRGVFTGAAPGSTGLGSASETSSAHTATSSTFVPPSVASGIRVDGVVLWVMCCIALGAVLI